MKIEDVKIEDAADANYIIRKFFNNQLKNIKIDQLEQLILTVYNLGKNSGGEAGSGSPVSETPVSANPFKINDRAKTVEEVEIAHSGEIINADTKGSISSVNGDFVSFLFESGEFGEMIETTLPFEKLEKIT